MANEVWFEIQGDSNRYPNTESARTAAQKAAKNTDSTIEVYRVARTLVKTVQRSVSVTETDVP